MVRFVLSCYSPYLAYSQLVHNHFFRILDSDLEDFVFTVALQETDLVTLLDGSREDSDQSDDTSEMVIAI